MYTDRQNNSPEIIVRDIVTTIQNDAPIIRAAEKNDKLKGSLLFQAKDLELLLSENNFFDTDKEMIKNISHKSLDIIEHATKALEKLAYEVRDPSAEKILVNSMILARNANKLVAHNRSDSSKNYITEKDIPFEYKYFDYNYDERANHLTYTSKFNRAIKTLTPIEKAALEKLKPTLEYVRDKAAKKFLYKYRVNHPALKEKLDKMLTHKQKNNEHSIFTLIDRFVANNGKSQVLSK